jgi:hypothetical protein
VEVTTRERRAKQEGIRPVPYLLTVFSPLVSPQFIVPATQKNKRRHGVTVAAAISSINFFWGAKHKDLICF